MSLLAALVLVSAQPALANTGDCGWVHGRYVETNGSRIHRIFVLGTGHALNVDIPDEGEHSVPNALAHYFSTGQFRGMGDQMLGEFYVCARERRIRGAMQPVSLKKVRHIRIARY